MSNKAQYSTRKKILTKAAEQPIEAFIKRFTVSRNNVLADLMRMSNEAQNSMRKEKITNRAEQLEETFNKRFAVPRATLC
jgi:ABC-type proline/glycine betaine transport system ATPase subunit